MSKFIIELYWEPTIPECGIWDRSVSFPDEYTKIEAEDIIRSNEGMHYRMRDVDR